uniref:PSI-F n=1 Tax=Alexandrium monilatum TaxID=311494 RepID=A0A7S4VSA1_9DINO
MKQSFVRVLLSLLAGATCAAAARTPRSSPPAVPVGLRQANSSIAEINGTQAAPALKQALEIKTMAVQEAKPAEKKPAAPAAKAAAVQAAPALKQTSEIKAVAVHEAKPAEKKPPAPAAQAAASKPPAHDDEPTTKPALATASKAGGEELPVKAEKAQDTLVLDDKLAKKATSLNARRQAEEPLKPIGVGAYQSAEAVKQRTLDGRRACEHGKWPDCFEEDKGDFLDGHSYGNMQAEAPAAIPARSAASKASGLWLGFIMAAATAWC